MSRTGSHFASDIETMEAELLRLARLPGSESNTAQMEALQLEIRDKEFTVSSRSADIPLARGNSSTPPEVHTDESAVNGHAWSGELMTLIKAAFFRIIEARTPRRETLCHAMAFGFDHPSYPSARQASVAFGCSHEEISFRVKEIQREYNLPANQFNKSATARAKYRQTNGAKKR